MDSINSCVKNSLLFKNGIIESRYLSINERVRQFGGHPTYARFLMYLGLGLLKRKRKDLYFKWNTSNHIHLPTHIEGHQIVKNYNGNFYILTSFNEFEIGTNLLMNYSQISENLIVFQKQ